MATTLEGIKERQQQTWASGDYAKVGAHLVLLGELLCEAAELHAGEKVLDVATGSGNAALAAARRLCDVTGVDYVPALLERGRERAAAEGLDNVTFVEGDAEQIPFPDGSFDVVLSTIGVMFAPDQQRAADELVRVCRSGGRIGVANWCPEGFVGGMLRTVGRYVAPPAGLEPPVRWGTEERIRELFGDRVTDLRCTRREFVFRFPSADFYAEYFCSWYGPTLKAHDSLDEAARRSFKSDLAALALEHNRSLDGTLYIPTPYLEVVATKR